MNPETTLNEGRSEHAVLARRIGAAIAFAAEVHSEQVYRGYFGRPDEPYILHPLRVMGAVTDRARVVAVLHDCLEDGGVLPPWLTQEERLAVWLLTRDKETDSYEGYIARLVDAEGAAAEIAREVKVADLRENLAHDPPLRLVLRYGAALAALNAEPHTPEKRFSGDPDR